jgi:type IV pilus assembly protein PilW
MMKLHISARPHRQAPGQRGMTLIELMVAMTIGLFLMLVLSAAYFNATQLFRTQNQLAELQDNGRSAIEVLTKELRMVGYMGCVNEASLAAAPPFVSMQGYDSVADYERAGNTLTETSFSGATGPVLVVRHGSYQSIPVTVFTAANITAGPDTFGWKGGSPQMLISDCTQATQFAAGAITVNGGITTIPAAAGTNIAGAFTNTARVRPVETSTFFLATPTGRSQPSLYQLFSNGYVNQYLRVADNVANWHLSYATGADDSKVDTTDQAASAVTTAGGWANVKSLRVDLSLIGSKPVLSEPASYWFNFTATTPTDRNLRKEMASTLALRNRIQGVQ